MATLRSENPVQVAVTSAPELMNAGVVVSPRCAERREMRVPRPGPNEILVRVEGCGICGSNLPVWEGRPWFEYPLEPGAPGHEAWGVVEQIGSDVTALAPGNRVGVLSGHGFAAYDVAKQDQSIPLPESPGKMAAFPAEPLGCAFNIARRSAFNSGENVVIVGIGFLGALLTKLAKLSGCHVTAVSRRKFAREMAERYGADAIFDWDGPNTAGRVLAPNNRKGFDCVIEAVGSQGSLDLATQLTKERGRLVIAGYHQESPRQVDMQLWNWRGLDVINAHERDPQVYLKGMREAVAAIQSGTIDPAPLYTHCFPLDELSDAFEMLRLRPEGFMKALVIP